MGRDPSRGDSRPGTTARYPSRTPRVVAGARKSCPAPWRSSSSGAPQNCCKKCHHRDRTAGLASWSSTREEAAPLGLRVGVLGFSTRCSCPLTPSLGTPKPGVPQPPSSGCAPNGTLARQLEPIACENFSETASPTSSLGPNHLSLVDSTTCVGTERRASTHAPASPHHDGPTRT